VNTFIKDIQQIMAIRKLRVDSSRRKQKLKALEQDQAARAIESAQAHFEQTEQRLIQIELETLQRLTNGNFVKVDQLVSFTKLQQQGIKKIKNIQQSIDQSHQQYESAQLAYQESCLKVNQAEKKLLGIEEVLLQKLWK
jgi:inorganic pyrophosphatase